MALQVAALVHRLVGNHAVAAIEPPAPPCARPARASHDNDHADGQQPCDDEAVTGGHSHIHENRALVHAHPHVPDLHLGHDHGLPDAECPLRSDDLASVRLTECSERACPYPPG